MQVAQHWRGSEVPAWAGKWKGGRLYLDEEGRPVFFIERRGRSIKLATHDEGLALGELSRFLADPDAYVRVEDTPQAVGPVQITTERIRLYLSAIRDTVADHRAARAKYLADWSKLGLDLRTVDRRALRVALADFEGGHRGRAEALNAFARFLVKEGDLATWNPLVNTHEPKATRAEREAYSLEQIEETYTRITSQRIKDLFALRALTGMHHTELEQLTGARITAGPLPDKGVAIRKLPAGHEIAGVLQVLHKSGKRHRQSVDAFGLAAALRLRDSRVPSRVVVWEAVQPLVPSNLRHTFVTLAGEVGKLITYKAPGVDRARIAQVVGHRAGSTMTADRYDKLQVPPMIQLPLTLK